MIPIDFAAGDTWVHLGLLAGWVFSAGILYQKVSDLSKWREAHEREARNGYTRLSSLEGGDTSVVHRLERAIEQVTETVQANAVQIGEVNGQVQALAQTVSMLVQRAFGSTVDRV